MGLLTMTTLTNFSLSMLSAFVIAQSAVPETPDITAIVERFGITGAFGVLLWWMLTQLSRKIDANTEAIKQLTETLRK